MIDGDRTIPNRTPKHVLIHGLWRLYHVTQGRPMCMRPEGHLSGCIAAPQGYTPTEVAS